MLWSLTTSPGWLGQFQLLLASVLLILGDGMKKKLTLWTDASERYGLSFVYSGNGFVYQLQSPMPGSPPIDIFFLELLAILSSIHHIAHFTHPPRRLLIFTDSLDSVAVLNTLQATETLHNSILLAIAEIMMKTNIDLRVHHIEGKKNTRADMLSGS